MVLKAVHCCLLLLVSLSSLAQLDKGVYYQHQSQIYFDQDRLKVAELYADSALYIAIRSAVPDSIANAYRRLYEIHLAAKDYQKALTDFRLAKVYRDSSEVLSRITVENSWESKLEEVSASHREEIENLRSDLKKQVENATQDRRNAMVIFLGVLALSIITVLFFYRKNIQLKTELEKSRGDVSQLQTFSEKLYSVLSKDLEYPSGPEALKTKLNHVIQWVSYQAKTKDFNQTEFDCKKLVEEILERFQSLLSANQISIELFMPEGLFAFADREMIAIVLENLVSNALHFTKPGGKIVFFCGKKDDLVTLGVKDSGMGIPEDQIQQFYTTGKDFQSDQSGDGIGLLLSKDLVERNGGRLYVESKVGQGSTFSFSIPSKKIE